jgi:deoxyribonuclease V
MKVYQQHRWDLSYSEATSVQQDLRRRVQSRLIALKRIRTIAGVDVAISRSKTHLVSAVVVFAFPSMAIIETQTALTPLTFPYIPGLLSFREIPALVECLGKVAASVDVVICDGHGIAHPRGVGLASHLGLLIRRPTIGCAKSLLVGEFGYLGQKKGSYAPLLYNGRRVGSVVRTRDATRPVFVSPGHLADQAGSRRLVLSCTTRFRLPEPTRQADRLAGDEKRRIGSAGVC